MRHAVVRVGFCLAVGLMVAGCATPPLDQARRQFYSGQLAEADTSLATIPADKDQALYLMERGMVRHLRHDYEGSSRDWLQAAQVEDKLETQSATKAGASLVVNDTVLAFRGYPYERALLRIFNARNYLARGTWDDAAVEGRNALRVLENLDGFPDDAYSRYMAGLCFELSGDSGGAEFQYRAAAQLDPSLGLDAATGRFMPATGAVVSASAASPPPPEPSTGLPCELVCLVDIAGTSWAPTADYAEIVCNGRTLGISKTLGRVEQLKWASEQRTAVKRAVKTGTRWAVKGALVYLAERKEGLGMLAAMILFALEAPDTRRWETLPLRLAVARVPCPANLTSFDVLFKNGSGIVLKRVTLTRPMARRDRVFFAFCRDTP